MSEAYKCDLTGELIEGTGETAVVAELTPLVRVRVTLQVREDDKERFRDGHMSPAAVDAIAKGLTPVVQKYRGKQGPADAKKG